ncbi:hypothetical protein [Chitinophaga filiformis]|uniref:RNA polymerase sigma-70 factor, ECF subfamily n=1 Tax=Chitinophaga filiformis TaxID=104663 RepID=A0ABY4I0X5_CHIFI|nr:hypothetical protein [Chitinophaga filiformis]UPK69740.1 hypothetical protein MYF79_00365 [Chitinophaga filiformis]
MGRQLTTAEERLLLNRIRKGDIEALELLFISHRQRVFVDAYLRLKDPAAAWSVTTEIYSWLWEDKPGLFPFASIKLMLQEEVKKRTIAQP